MYALYNPLTRILAETLIPATSPMEEDMLSAGQEARQDPNEEHYLLDYLTVSLAAAYKRLCSAGFGLTG